MDTRALWALGLSLSALALWHYQLAGPQAPGVRLADLRMDYSARDIRLLQTTPTGQLEAETTAQALYHYPQPERTELQQLQSRWYQNGQLRAELSAAQAQADQGYQRIDLSGGVRVSQPAPSGQPGEGTVLQTETLTGYPRRKVIETAADVHLTSGTATFFSQGLQADLSSGQYQLHAPRIRYVPAP